MQSYGWKRFWYPRGSDVEPSDAGYLYDPDSKYGHVFSKDVASFGSIARFPCLVLLGEPGIGKSHAIRAEYEEAAREIEKEGGQSLFMDLHSYGDEGRLIGDLFRSSTWTSWFESEGKLLVFLDSLDECLLNIRTVASLLKDELGKYPVEQRLSLRIACRTADWPSVLEEGLRKAWGKDAVGVFELAPLRRVDVAKAAEDKEGVDTGKFMDEVWRREAVPLAAKPITLDMLLNIYQRDGRFPRTQANLYLEGCRVLCEEFNKNRLASGNTGTLTADQRMAVAARIAAATVFANRSAVWTAPDRGDVFKEDVLLRDLSGGEESTDGDQFPVSEAAVKETLSTGLFSSRGPNRIGWAHQTYAEFLAAHYLACRTVTTPKIMSLIMHPGDRNGKLVPQLHETAAWLAGRVPEVFRRITEVDPEVLLRSDVATAGEQDRAALVETLLAKYDREELLDVWGSRGRYEDLYHPSLFAQVRPYITDRSKGLIVRRAAIEIVEACHLEALQEDLIDVALDPIEPMDIRSYAAGAATEIGGDAVVRLKPLATGDVGEDPEDQLKEEVLKALWPSHMTAEELFSILTPPKRTSYSWSYNNFVSGSLPEFLKPEDLPIALRWVEHQQSRHAMPDSFGDLMDEIMAKAWENLELPGMVEAFARAALSRSKWHDVIVADKEGSDHGSASTFRSVLSAEDDKRRRLIEAALPMLHDPKDALDLLLYSDTPLVLSKDVPWMLERLRTAASAADRLMLTRLVERAFDWHDPDQFSMVVEAGEEALELKQAVVWHTEPIQLSSSEAQRMKADYYEMQERRNRRKELILLDPPPAELIARHLDGFEAGDLDSWWRMNLEMTLEPHSTHYDSRKEDEPDLTSLPGWTAASAETRGRMLKAAEKYVVEYEPDIDYWLREKNLRSALAGYRAIRLLLQEKPEFFAGLSSETWRKWAPIFLTYPTTDGDTKDGIHDELLKAAYRHSPEEIVRTVISEIDRDDEGERGFLSALRKIGGLWDERLAQALLEKSKDEKLGDASLGILLATLVDRGVNGVREFAESLLASSPPLTGGRRSRAVVAAQVLVGHAKDAGWPVVWPAMQQDAEFRCGLVSAVVAHHKHRSLWHKFSEEQLTGLFVWLSRHYPQAEDPNIEGYHTIGHREQISRWRDSILGHLAESGTYQACDAIRQIARELPELDSLKWTLQRAENVARRSTWTPPRPGDILTLCRERRKSLVQNGNQLLDVLADSLGRMQVELQGETYAAIDLWDRTSRSKYKPVDENRLSDYVKRYLEQDLKGRGVVVNREVEIRSGRGSSPGELTDIYVEAVTKSPDEEHDKVSAIIEVKGGWHPELKMAMETQLVGRYLKDNPCHHGLYLVGWFSCDQWDGRDYRKNRAPKLSLEQVRNWFEAQAAELSSPEMTVRSFVVDARLR